MKGTAAVISLGSKSSKMTAEAMRKYFEVVDELSIKDIEVNVGVNNPSILYKGKKMKHYDCIFAKGSFRYAPLLSSIASLLPKTTFAPLGSDAYTFCHDKILTQLVLHTNHIPTPKTYLTPLPESARQILERINYPIIMKFPQGTQGKGVMVAESLDSASSMMDALTALKQPFLIQEYIDTGGTDIRAIVVGDKVIASMKRKAVKGETRANIHAGATGEACFLDPLTKKIAVKAAQAAKAGICGVDILEGTHGPVVIELNISPGLQGITEVTKIDIADKIAKYLHDETLKIINAEKEDKSSEILQDLGISKAGQDLIANVSVRGNRILLPEVITKITKFVDKEEVTIQAEKKKVTISKLNIG